MKIEKILLPFDGSVHSIHAADYALNLARLSESHVTIVQCYNEGSWDLSGISDVLIEGIKSNRKKTAVKILSEAEAIFTGQGVQYQLKAIAGFPGDVLADLAKSEKYDLIVMGSGGHSDIAGLFLGSVTHRVLDTIYCPILIVP